MMRNLLANAVTRSLSQMFPGHFNGSRKHDHYRDFGWPDQVTFAQLFRAYTRNSLAAAAVDKTVSKTWQDNPALWESEKPAESLAESDIRQRFDDLRVWQAMAEADRRSMVGRYAGIVLRLRDGLDFDKPVQRVPGGLDGIAEIIPAWESQLEVAEWASDHGSENYGKPLFYQFNEAAIGGESQSRRQFRVHPDRVLIWSDDGTVNCRSALEPIYNDLLDAEKIKGAGGEGFWKTSRGAPVIEAPEGMRPQDVAQAMGVQQGELIDAINEQIDSFQAGFDKGLMLGGMTAKPLQINLPSPEHFFAAPINSIAAAVQMPVKIMMGSQTGERASTEDAAEWSQVCNARRINRIVPLIKDFIRRLERFGILPDRDWVVGWVDLTEAAIGDRLDRAAKMSAINAQTQPGDDPAFTPDEIREAAGYDPAVDHDGLGDEPPEGES